MSANVVSLDLFRARAAGVAATARASEDPDVTAEVFGPDGLLARAFPGYEPRTPQVDLARAVDRAITQGITTGQTATLAAEGPTGTGKCHRAGTQVLMHDGSTKAVESIRVGDIVQGPSGPRRVLGTNQGVGEMYDVVPVKGEPWGVNADHILTIVQTDTDQVMDITVRDYLGRSPYFRHRAKLFRTGADFAPRAEPLPLDPYVLGVILGDGCASGVQAGGVSVTTGAEEIVTALNSFAHARGMRLTRGDVRAGCAAYRLAFRKRHERSVENPVTGALRRLGLYGHKAGTKFVPQQYKSASRADRLEVLAGLLDTDGSVTCGCYDYVSKSEQLARDVAFLARGVGLAAYLSPTRKFCQTGASGIYYRVCISGNTSVVPCRIKRKRIAPRRQQKDALRTGFKVVSSGSVETYYGFTLDGDGRYLLADFTVTHNSVSYLAPAIMHGVRTGLRTLVVTANNALLEQLLRKDLPTLQRVLTPALPRPFTFAGLMGRGQYLCRNLVPGIGADVPADPLSDRDALDLERIDRWARTTATGERAELTPGVTDGAWEARSVTGDDCTRDGCPLRSTCHAYAAHDAAAMADVVVTNIALLLMHLRVAGETGRANILPRFDVLVIDEAHELPDKAREAFGLTMGRGAFFMVEKWLRGGKKGGKKNVPPTDECAEILRWLSRDADALFAAAMARMPSRCRGVDAQGRTEHVTLCEPGWYDGDAVMHWLRRVREEAAKVAGSREDGDPECVRAQNTSRRALQIMRAVEELTQLPDGLVSAEPDVRRVYWIEADHAPRRHRTGPRITFRGAPLAIGPTLRRGLWGMEGLRAVVAVSATLTTGPGPGGWTHPRRELGIPDDAVTLAVPSPFDYARQSLLVVPGEAWEMPSPVAPQGADRTRSDERYTAACARVLLDTIRAADGRTLALFSSRRALTLAAELVRGASARGELPAGVRVLVQEPGASRRELAETFKADVRSVLLGLQSFGTGFDPAGETCSAVFVDKLPFPSRGDPLMEGLCDAAGDQWFGREYLPRMLLTLRQWVGRAIRTRSDVAAVVIADPRVGQGPGVGAKSYARDVCAAVGADVWGRGRGMPITTDLDRVRALLGVDAPPRGAR